MGEILISILTPCFKPGDFLPQCISSVRNASDHCEGVEHIIIDGGSGIETVNQLELYKMQAPNLRYISEPDQGQSDALNKGVRMAKGKWIGILNCDDLYEPGLFKKLQPVLSSDPGTKVHVGKCKIVSPNGGVIGINSPNATTWQRLIIGEPWFQFPCNPCAYFYPKAIHNDIGLYSQDETYLMDLDFLIRLSTKLRFTLHEEIWGNFLMHENCKTASLIQNQSLESQKSRLRKQHLNSAPILKKTITVLHKRILQSRFKWLLPSH